MEKSVQLQQHIRQNSEELQDYLRDLVNWEKEMKRKEEEIKKRTHQEPVLPPIRTADSSSKKKKTKSKKGDSTKEKSKKPEEQEKLQKATRIPGYDYQAWELFNVDEALKEVDECEEKDNKKSSSEEDTEESEDEMYEVEKKKQLALIEKDKGNQFFKKGNYDSAIACYTTGISHDPANPLLPANRAMAFLKKGQLAAAETDCTTCLSLDPTYVKAYMRRATACLGLKKYQEAGKDFLKVLDLEPDNNQAKLELERLQKELLLFENKINVDSKENEKDVNNLAEVPESSKEQTTALEGEHKTGVTNSYQPSDICSRAGGEKGDSSVKLNDRLQQLLKPEDKDSCVIKAIQKPPHLRSKKPMETIKIKDVSGITEYDGSAGDEENVVVLPVCGESLQTEDMNETMDCSVDPEHSVSSESSVKISETVMSVPLILPALPAVPLTSYQFLSDWKKLKHYPELLYKYVKQFPPEKLPVVFKQSIDTELFCDILQILSTIFVDNCEDVFSYLTHLRKVGRFQTLVMFLAEEEITALNQLFQFIKSSEKYSLEEIQSVEKDYGLS